MTNNSLRETIKEAMKTAMKAKNSEELAAIRMILSKIKDADINARTSGNNDGISDAEILSVLQSMTKQRRESIKMYEDGGRDELAQKEKDEIAVIEKFLPQQMNEVEMKEAIQKLVGEVGAQSVKDMGKVMGALKTQYAGQLDMSKAGPLVKEVLNG